MIFIFGQAEKGVFCRPTYLKNALDLLNHFGHPPELSSGIFFAVQTLLLKKPCIFYRVEEEGYSYNDYLRGLDILKSDWQDIKLEAIGLPGVGDPLLIEKTERFCMKKRSLILVTETDLFDFLTH
jgi:hypothetical protein